MALEMRKICQHRPVPADCWPRSTAATESIDAAPPHGLSSSRERYLFFHYLELRSNIFQSAQVPSSKGPCWECESCAVHAVRE